MFVIFIYFLIYYFLFCLLLFLAKLLLIPSYPLYFLSCFVITYLLMDPDMCIVLDQKILCVCRTGLTLWRRWMAYSASKWWRTVTRQCGWLTWRMAQALSSMIHLVSRIIEMYSVHISLTLVLLVVVTLYVFVLHAG